MKVPFEKIFLVVVGLAALLLGAALLVAAIHLGSEIGGYGVILTFQFLLIILLVLCIIIAAAIAIGLVMTSTELMVQRIDKLRIDHADLLRRLQKRTPTFAALIALAAGAVKAVRAKSFAGHEEEVVIVSLALLMLFWIANQLVLNEARWKRRVGYLVWFLTIALVPAMVMGINDWNFTDLVAAINDHIERGTRLVLGLVAIVLVLLPFSFRKLHE